MRRLVIVAVAIALVAAVSAARRDRGCSLSERADAARAKAEMRAVGDVSSRFRCAP